MKKNILFIGILGLMLSVSGCTEYLDLTPLDKVSSDQLLASEDGLNTLLAALYNSAPIEDFTFRANEGFNQRGWSGVDYMLMTSMYTDESIKSDGGQAIGPGGYQFFANDYDNANNNWRVHAYKRIREVNLFFDNLETAKNTSIISEDTYNQLKSETHFIRAYIYFGLVKRYGGVPIILKAQDSEYVPRTDNSALFVPRSTELDTWKLVLSECDLAIANLPATWGNTNTYRATKWAAYGLKSRAALHAASLAKYWDKAPLIGAAVNQKLVGGMSASDAEYFYTECINASKAIIDNSGKSLYEPNPADPAKAAANYQNLFMTAPATEVIFSKGYLDGTQVSGQGHNFDIYFSPAQVNPGFHKYGRFAPTLDMVDLYEDYTDDGTGKSAKIVTRTDGNEDYYTADPKNLNVSIPFKKYDNPYDAFKNKDARMLASIIVPGATYKGTTIVMQGGLIDKDGSLIGVYAAGSKTGQDGKTYFSYGAENSYSGFFGMGRSDDANFSSTGFSIRKFLAENKNISGAERSSTTPWIDMRLAEFYLNYAEATVESGKGDPALAGQYINALRKRAAHKDNIPLTLDNVLKERRVEMAFEGARYWDMVRRRDYHSYFTSGKRHALVPMMDLREAQPKTVLVRVNLYYDEQAGGRTFDPVNYYFSIPGTNTNRLIQNPGH